MCCCKPQLCAVATTTWTQASIGPSGYSRSVVYTCPHTDVMASLHLQTAVLLLGTVSFIVVHWRQARIDRMMAHRIEQQIRA